MKTPTTPAQRGGPHEWALPTQPNELDELKRLGERGVRKTMKQEVVGRPDPGNLWKRFPADPAATSCPATWVVAGFCGTSERRTGSSNGRRCEHAGWPAVQAHIIGIPSPIMYDLGPALRVRRGRLQACAFDRRIPEGTLRSNAHACRQPLRMREFNLYSSPARVQLNAARKKPIGLRPRSEEAAHERVLSTSCGA